MSNLFAGLGWTIVELLARPHLVDAGAGRRPPAGRGVRAGVDPGAPALDHAAAGPASRWRCDDGVHRLAVEPGMTIATLLPLTNLSAGARPRPVGRVAVGGPPPPGRRRPAGDRARHRVRPRQAHVPGPAVLAGRDHAGGHPPPRPLRPHRGLRRPAAGAGPDRRRGPLGRPLPGPLLGALTGPTNPAARPSRAAARTRPGRGSARRAPRPW